MLTAVRVLLTVFLLGADAFFSTLLISLDAGSFTTVVGFAIIIAFSDASLI